ncbi:hypothetical protein J6590_021613 [Homalodisca vitripennis]|nr:hypothetical protein J6590_021613 [Homalodisca vitripennis]
MRTVGPGLVCCCRRTGTSSAAPAGLSSTSLVTFKHPPSSRTVQAQVRSYVDMRTVGPDCSAAAGRSVLLAHPSCHNTAAGPS